MTDLLLLHTLVHDGARKTIQPFVLLSVYQVIPKNYVCKARDFGQLPQLGRWGRTFHETLKIDSMVDHGQTLNWHKFPRKTDLKWLRYWQIGPLARK